MYAFTRYAGWSSDTKMEVVTFAEQFLGNRDKMEVDPAISIVCVLARERVGSWGLGERESLIC